MYTCQNIIKVNKSHKSQKVITIKTQSIMILEIAPRKNGMAPLDPDYDIHV